MIQRVAALCAALIFGLLPVAWVAAATADQLDPGTTAVRGVGSVPAQEMEVLAGGPDPSDLPPRLEPSPPPRSQSERDRRPSRSGGTAPAPAPVIAGTASTYAGTAGFGGQATVALPGAMGGRYTGGIQGWVTVCADRCARLAVVDWCQCHWGTRDQRVADISHAAWPLLTDRPLSSGLVEVRVILDDPELAAAWAAPRWARYS